MSRPFLLAVLGGMTLLLSGVVVWEYREWRRDQVFTLPPPRQAVSHPESKAVAAPGQDQVAPILARPLFNPSRRPVVTAVAAVSAAAAAAPTILPRLTGVMIGNGQATAIFAGPPNGRSLVVTEGGWVGRYQVRSIRTGQVILAGPDGPAFVRPTFAPSQTAPPGSSAPVTAAGAAPGSALPANPSGPPPSGPPPSGTAAPVTNAPTATGGLSVLDQLLRGTPSIGIPGLPAPGVPGQ